MTLGDAETAGIASGLPSRVARLAELIAAGKSQPQAAAIVGVFRSTVTRAARGPRYCKLVDEFRAQAIASGVGSLIAAFSTAAAQLARLCKEGTTADAVKLGACRTVIDAVLRVRDADLQQRVAELERRRDGRTFEEAKASLLRKGVVLDRLYKPIEASTAR